MMKLSTKCWISAFYAQCSRGIIVVVQVGAVKIDVAAVEPLRQKERQGETQEPSKLLVFWVSTPGPPSLNVNVLFCRFFSNLNLCMTKLRVLVLSFPDFTDISNTLLLLAASTLIIFLSENLKYSKKKIPVYYFFWR